jgi:hypothetical protein
MIVCGQYKQKRDMATSHWLINVRWRLLNSDKGNPVLRELVCRIPSKIVRAVTCNNLKHHLGWMSALTFLPNGMRHSVLLTLAKRKVHCQGLNVKT